MDNTSKFKSGGQPGNKSSAGNPGNPTALGTKRFNCVLPDALFSELEDSALRQGMTRSEVVAMFMADCFRTWAYFVERDL